MLRYRFQALTMVLVLVFSASCSGQGPDLPANQMAQVNEAVSEEAKRSSITLSRDDVECVVSELSTQEAVDLVGQAELTPSLIETLPEAIVGCVGVGPIVSGVVTDQVPLASSDELDCAIDRIDRDLAVVLVSSALEGPAISKPSVELSLASALAFCLTVENLLNQG